MFSHIIAKLSLIYPCYYIYIDLQIILTQTLLQNTQFKKKKTSDNLWQVNWFHKLLDEIDGRAVLVNNKLLINQVVLYGISISEMLGILFSIINSDPSLNLMYQYAAKFQINEEIW